VLDTYTHRYILACVMAKKPTKKNMTWTPNVEDWKLMQELKSKTGISNDSDVVRLGLRKLAEAEGLR